ncbi:adenosine deaminase [Celerinatantimonas diazotrophica]|uniref:Adenine deaminase n=1 Tax=Celerinatantimonas diazotrophica TaxID=412034 RepID=A0A4R1K257_9GAMM|nr:adenosine deaminase [Celerinatantimonas diazotrophica]TCK58062.1 adenosine deaminase [Celerinatantimonas diazotrophica]CAG9297869.1 Adenine deaminase [Celerinatantimonas diazotrophica]
MREFIQGLPKVELHLHIEGTLEPELMFELAQRNQVKIPFSSPEQVRSAYQFSNLQSFLDIYYQGANVLLYQQDFFDLTWHYLLQCHRENVRHCEIFFDPQTHTQRGIAFETVINGIIQALEKGRQELGITSHLILCFLRHLDEHSALQTLDQALAYRELIIGVGLDSSEQGNPPQKFARVFAKAERLGFKRVAHAGEEGPAQNIRTAIESLHVNRVDHGVRCVEDSALVAQLIESQMPLTVCPLSNIKLKVFSNMREHNIVELLDKGMCVTINSDDPAYFGGYMNQNFHAIADVFALTHQQLAKFSINAINASFIHEDDKQKLRQEVFDYMQSYIG